MTDEQKVWAVYPQAVLFGGPTLFTVVASQLPGAMVVGQGNSYGAAWGNAAANIAALWVSPAAAQPLDPDGGIPAPIPVPVPE